MRFTTLLLVSIFFSGCAYGYASQEGKKRREPVAKTSVKVVEVKDTETTDDDGTSESTTTKTTTTIITQTVGDAPPKSDSPCGVETFTVMSYTAQKAAEKTVDCSTRKVVAKSERVLAQADYEAARAAGLPEGSWYLLVDPKGTRSEFLNNDNLLKLSRVFTIEYFGRDSSRDLLVYVYQEDSP